QDAAPTGRLRNYTLNYAVHTSTLRPRFYLTIVPPKTSVGRFPAYQQALAKAIHRRKDASCCVGLCLPCCLCCCLCRLLPSLLWPRQNATSTSTTCSR